MSETIEELQQNAVDVEADILKEYILSQGDELYNYFNANLSDLETICHLIVKHWNDPYLSIALKKKLNELLKIDCADKAKQRIYE